MNLRSLTDVIYPIHCFRCNGVQEGDDARYLCDACYHSYQRIGVDSDSGSAGFCAKCSEPFDGAFSENPVCPNCSGLSYSFDFARCALKNTEEARAIIHQFKYQKQRHLAGVLADICADVITHDERLSDLVQRHAQDTIVMPVPLHWRRQLFRGFNQAELVSKLLAERLDLPHIKLLKRIRYTTTQTKLIRHERLRNLQNAFAVSSKWRQITDFKRVIMVDDVFTTGSTSEACAAVIKKECAKVENIVVVTVLRG